MKNLIVILGPPGVGKGTQCNLLKSRLGFYHISTGAIIRNEIQSNSELGLKVKSIVESGNLVDDQTIFSCLENALSELNTSSEFSILLDGLPRNLSQANDLDTLVSKFNFSKVVVIALDADVEKIVSRFKSRYTCSSCSYIGSFPEATSDNYKTLLCPSCHKQGSLARRPDDEELTVRHRLELYKKETHPLLDYYKKKDNLHIIDGLMSPELVYVNVASCLI
jgi:adenylate kinase